MRRCAAPKCERAGIKRVEMSSGPWPGMERALALAVRPQLHSVELCAEHVAELIGGQLSAYELLQQ